MKKLTKVLFLICLLCAFSSAPVLAANWTIEVNGNKLDTEVKEINDRTLVPLRAVGEALNLDVNYDSANGIVALETTNDNFSSASIWLDKKENLYYAKIIALSDNYKQFNLTRKREGQLHMMVAPVEINDRLYVPVRIICDSFGAPVEVKGNTISIGACFTAEGNTENKIKALLTTKNANQTSTSSDPLIGKWEIIRLNEYDAEGYGGYVRFYATGEVKIKLPLVDEQLPPATWKFYTENKENGLIYRHYLVNTPEGINIGVASISGSIGVYSVGDNYIAFEK